jgi:hypothetical protein
MNSLDSASAKPYKCTLPPFFPSKVSYARNKKVHMPATANSAKVLSNDPSDCRSSYLVDLVVIGKRRRIIENRAAQAFSANSLGKSSSFSCT